MSIQPDTIDLPFRMTQTEWDDLWNGRLQDGHSCWYVFPRAEVTMSGSWCGAWDYQDEYDVTLNHRKPKTFGPHRTFGLARQKALAFLIAQKVIEIIPE